MTNVLLVTTAVLAGLSLLLQLFRPGRTATADATSTTSALAQVERATERTERAMRDEISKTREEAANSARQGREELAHPISQMRQTIDHKLTEVQDANGRHFGQMREDLLLMLEGLTKTTAARMTELHGHVARLTETNEARFERLTLSAAQNAELLKTSVETNLHSLREDNGKQLEQMRLTVDEKLQGTLEKRLGDSFKLVSDRLEQVHKGLGEMQVLATGVGDLKKVLSNVKTRGTWGEVQLRTLLSQVMSPAQFEENVSPKNNGERVEFVVKMPGRTEDEDLVWLPIDAKFPLEDYSRLVTAYEAGDKDAEHAARLQLEARIKTCAKEIASKYICAPRTTDFAILFLPSESLFAEVVRNADLPDLLQRDYRVMLAGPTTLWSILNSLQMGFRTLAIQKRSSEVWRVLASVKTEWSKYGEILDKVKKKLDEAGNVVDEASKRSRAVGRKLGQVEDLPSAEITVLGLADDAASEPVPAQL